MGKRKELKIEGLGVGLINSNDNDFISLSDMAKFRDDTRTDYIVQNWIRNKNTIEFIGLWESLNNPSFNSIEFDGIRNSAGVNAFTITPKKWIQQTNAIGIQSKAGRYGGTYAHKDIAFEFASWLSPIFKLYLIKEFQRLKDLESNQYNLEWNIKRVLTKANYRLHTDAIKDFIIPKSKLPKGKERFEYAKEADILNLALFGCTAKDWRLHNPTPALEGMNIRDIASINELTVLANLESFNSQMIKEGFDQKSRYLKISEIAKDQLKKLNNIDFIKSVRNAKDVYPDLQELKKDLKVENLSDYNKKLKQALQFDDKKKTIK